ncbi:hypothetical protein BGZ96_009410 [Linnemannia gamsii]|uniref:Ubiquitin-like domain-containing protein n=1 Tax=Linnemannia gamsii TaxID=64522 RepID=A0ABQ7KD81_9FUNG|nr:hypothetical protein BGZ96_009410 [Linnemannia gamsii]
MSYARVNDTSDSEDEAPNSSTTPSAIHSPPPPPRTRQASSVAAATLAALTRRDSSNRQEYSRLDEDDDDAGGLSTQAPVGAGVDRRQDDEQYEPTGQSRRRSQDQVQKSRTEENADLDINIRFGEGQDLSLRVPRSDTITQVKDKIKEARPSIASKYLRLIHSGKILVDNKTLIESLPKSLFTQVEVPQQHHQSRLSSSVEAVEAAANNILAGIASRTSGEKSTPPTIRTHTSLGSILPTHVSSTATQSTASTLPPPSSTTPATATHPLSSGGGGGGYTIIDIPSDGSSHGNNNPNSTSTISIPVQTGPIYFLCSLSDFPPAQPAGPTAVKKGKAVATGTGSSSNNNTSGRLRRDGSNSEDEEGETRDGAEEEEEEEEEELSPIMAPQATGFDRLREAGFSEDEIRSIRRQFHASRGTVTSTVGENGIAVGLDQDEDASARARRIEEEWIDQHGAETLPEGLEGSYGEMVWGLMLGFFMGLIVLFWFKEATFSRRQQMGIIAGLMINVGFGVLHLYY